MRTRVTDSVEEAAKEILKGNVVAFPTRTVYGLGANAFDEKAVRKIFEAKQRPADNPLVVHIYSEQQLFQLAKRVDSKTMKLIKAFWPGPLTVVLEKNPEVPAIVTGGLQTICVRMPALKITKDFLKACGVPIAAPSANLSGKPSPTSWEHVFNDLSGRIPLILKGQDCEFGVESTIINCLGKTPVLLRPGAVPVEDVERIIGKVRVPRKFKKALSPGMAYRHYAPIARVVLVKSVAETPKEKGKWAFIGFDDCEKALFKAKPKDSREYARLVFDFLRDSDSLGVETIYAQLPENKGFGRALLDRLKRSALK